MVRRSICPRPTAFLARRAAQIFCLLTFVLAAVLLSANVGVAQKPRDLQDKDRIPGNQFVFGINLPWFDGQYNHDLGPNPKHPNWKIWYDSAKVSRYFEDINRIGFGVVRIWLMEAAEGLVVDQDGIITGLDPTFLRNLDDLVRRADDGGIRLYLCLTNSWGEVGYPSPISSRQQAAYIDRAVRPLARRFKGNKTVFAFDIFNEVESEVRDNAPQKVSWAEAQSFIKKNAQAIKAEDPQRLVSAGSGWGDWKHVKEGRYRNLGLDFYDIHVYRDDGFLPDLKELNADKPVIVGECGQLSKQEDDNIQKKSLLAFFRNAVEKGYAGCIPWEYGPKGKYLKITRENGEHKPVVADIAKLINGYSPKQVSKETADSLKRKLSATKWVNSNNASFEWTADGRFLHKGNEREWKALDGQRVLIIFGPSHSDTLIFNSDLTEFKQLVGGGPQSFQGKRQ